MFSSLENAEKSMMENILNHFGEDDDKGHFFFIITERRVDPQLDTNDVASIRTYNGNGQWYEENMVDRDGAFHGRPVDRIRFHVGDIVEVYDEDEIRLAIVSNTPPSEQMVERRWKRRLAEGLSESDRSFCLDMSDDQYTVYDSRPRGHSHIQSQFVFPPSMRVPVSLVQKLKDQMTKGD